MDDILKQILVIGNVKTRLSALANHRGTPENVRVQLMTEAESLDWAYKELKQKHIVNVMIVVGDYEFVKTIDGIPHAQLHVATNISDAVIFEPDEVVYGKIKSFLFPDPGVKGNKLKLDQVPSYIQCDGYFASIDDLDINKRSMLFECQVSKAWLTGLGYNTARINLATWATAIFKATEWDKAERHDDKEKGNE